MKVNIKNIDLIAMYNTLMKFSSIDTNKYFTYSIRKNLSMVENDIKILRELSSPKKEYIDFQNKRTQLCEKYSELDVNGKPIIYKNSYSIKQESQTEYHEEMKKLVDEHKSILEDQIKNKNEYDKILTNEIEFDFVGVDFIYLPENISEKDYKSIENIVTNCP